MELSVENLEAEALKMADSMPEVFLLRLLRAEEARQQNTAKANEFIAQESLHSTFPKHTTELSEVLCRKHGHQPWCSRMQLLDHYTALAKAAHRARKKYFDIGGSHNETSMSLFENALSVARNRYRCSDCDCTKLTSSDSIQWEKPDVLKCTLCDRLLTSPEGEECNHSDVERSTLFPFIGRCIRCTAPTKLNEDGRCLHCERDFLRALRREPLNLVE